MLQVGKTTHGVLGMRSSRDGLAPSVYFVPLLELLLWACLPPLRAEPLPQRQPPRKTDLNGDPLPPGAVARLGAVSKEKKGDLTTEDLKEKIHALFFTPDGKNLASINEAGKVCLWDLALRKPLRKFKTHSEITGDLAVAYSPDGKHLAVGYRHGAELWDLAGGRKKQAFKTSPEGKEDKVTALAFSADGRLLAGGTLSGSIYLWTVETGKLFSKFQGEEGRVESLGFLGGGKEIACVSIFAIPSLEPIFQVERWRISTREKQKGFKFRGNHRDWVGLTPDGRWLWREDSSIIQLWNPFPRKKVGQFQGGASDDFEIPVAFSPDSRTLAVLNLPEKGGKKSILLWEVASGQVRYELPVGRGAIPALAFSPDGRSLASAYWNRSILIWDLTGWSGEKPARKRKLRPEEMESLWAELGSKNARRAYRALWALVSSPGQAVSFLEKRLKPLAGIPLPEDENFSSQIRDLDSPQYKIRRKAYGYLAKKGEAALPAIRGALKGPLSPEARRQLEKLAEIWEKPPSWKHLQGLRAIEVLEGIGKSRARALLQDLSRGAPQSWVTREAKGALERQKKLAEASR